MWTITHLDEFSNRFPEYQEKHADSVRYVATKLEVIFEALKNGAKLQDMHFTFLKHLKAGVYEVRCSVRGMRTTRLYFHVSIQKQVLYLLLIGDKNTQSSDIEWCLERVADIKDGGEP